MALFFILLALLPCAFSQSVCIDNSIDCKLFKSQGLCNNPVAKGCMGSMCPLSCGICKPPIGPGCSDLTSDCSSYARHGLCANHVTRNCMAATCPLSCQKCGNPTTAKPPTSKPNGKGEFQCRFEKTFCLWVNEPIDDSADWSLGISTSGPNKGADSSTSYAFLNISSSGKIGRLFIPWELALPIGVTNKGSMCLKFKYVLSDGSLRVIDHPYPTANNKNPSVKTLKVLSKRNSWSDALINVNVDDGRKLVIEGVKGNPGTTVAVDNVEFVSGQC